MRRIALIHLGAALFAAAPAFAEHTLLFRFCSLWVGTEPGPDRWTMVESSLREKSPLPSLPVENPKLNRCLDELKESFEFAEFISAGMRHMNSTTAVAPPKKDTVKTRVQVEGMPAVEVDLTPRASAIEVAQETARLRRDRYRKLWNRFMSKLKARVETLAL